MFRKFSNSGVLWSVHKPTISKMLRISCLIWQFVTLRHPAVEFPTSHNIFCFLFNAEATQNQAAMSSRNLYSDFLPTEVDILPEWVQRLVLYALFADVLLQVNCSLDVQLLIKAEIAHRTFSRMRASLPPFRSLPISIGAVLMSGTMTTLPMLDRVQVPPHHWWLSLIPGALPT